MKAKEAKKLTEIANTVSLKSIFKQIQKAAQQGIYRTHVETTDIIIITELRDMGYKVDPFEGRWIDGALVSWDE